MALHAHFASTLTGVVPQLAALLAEPTDDLFTRELIVVPSAGVQQWLIERLTRGLGARPTQTDGIIANVDMVFPAALSTRLLGQRASDDHWSVDRLTPTLLDLIAARPDQVPAGRRRDGLLAAARRTADLFDRYAFHRPGMILRWAEGQPVLQELAGEPEPPLPTWARWQFALWREARMRINQPCPPERHRDAIVRLRDGALPSALPQRVFIVGVTALPPLHVELLLAVAPHVDIHVWFSHPSPGLLHTTRPLLGDLPRQRIAQARHPAPQVARLPQLNSWTRPSQAMQVLLASAGITPALPPVEDASGSAPTSLLSRVQRALRHDELPAPIRETTGQARADASLRLHRAHGLTRQCEVLREALLHTARELPDLDPRDVLVIAPDIAAVAPHLDAVFPARASDGPADDPLALPLRVADRSLSKVNEVAGVLDGLLALPEGRAGLGDLRALCAVPALRRALGVDESTIELWFAWAEQLRVRWGLTAEHRAGFGIPSDVDVHTWHNALQRLVAGAVLSPAAQTQSIGTVVAARGVEIGELSAIGALARLLQQLTRFVDASTVPRRIADWCDLVQQLLESLTAMPRNEEEPRARVLRLLAAIRANALHSNTPVQFGELRALLAPVLAGDPPRVSLRSGSITATSLVPLRGVPYRVVCLVGLDDGAFSAGDGDGEDLLREQPMVGDPDPRGEQRQAFLEALLQASERVILTCTGFDPRSNATVEPITPVSELLDLVRAVGGDPNGITIDHPRHAADPRNFTQGALVPDTAFGHFASQRHAGKHFLTLQQQRDVTVALPVVDVKPVKEIAAEDLIQLLDDPLELYAKRTLRIDVFEKAGDPLPLLPTNTTDREFALAAGAWLDRRRHAADARGEDPTEWRAAMARTGWLPPLGLATKELDDAEGLVAELQRQCLSKQIPLETGRTIELRIPLPDGRVVTGTVPGVFDDAPYRHVQVVSGRNNSTLAHRQLVLTWLLALQLADPGVTSFYIGQKDDRKDRGSAYARRGGAAEGRTLDALREGLVAVVALHDEARRAPRPLFGETAKHLLAGDLGKARSAFASHDPPNFTAERRLYGAEPRFDAVFADPTLLEFLARWQACSSQWITVTNDRATPKPRASKGGGA